MSRRRLTPINPIPPKVEGGDRVPTNPKPLKHKPFSITYTIPRDTPKAWPPIPKTFLVKPPLLPSKLGLTAKEWDTLVAKNLKDPDQWGFPDKLVKAVKEGAVKLEDAKKYPVQEKWVDGSIEHQSTSDTTAYIPANVRAGIRWLVPKCPNGHHVFKYQVYPLADKEQYIEGNVCSHTILPPGWSAAKLFDMTNLEGYQEIDLGSNCFKSAAGTQALYYDVPVMVVEGKGPFMQINKEYNLWYPLYLVNHGWSKFPTDDTKTASFHVTMEEIDMAAAKGLIQ